MNIKQHKWSILISFIILFDLTLIYFKKFVQIIIIIIIIRTNTK